MARSSRSPAGRRARARWPGRVERRSSCRNQLRGCSAISHSSVRKRSAQAVSGRQKKKLTDTTVTIITPTASATRAPSPSSRAWATYEPMPGRALSRWLTLIVSEALSANQAAPKLIMPFQTWEIMPLGTSSFQNRCHRVSPISRAASSSSRGWVASDW